MTLFLENHHYIWYTIAGICLLLELGIMGLSGPLLFFAIASVITGFLINIGLIDGWAMEVLVAGILSGVIAVLMWKPLKNLQNTRNKTDQSSDMIGLQVTVADDVSKASGSIRYSGINWNARLADEVDVAIIAQNQLCEIVAITGTTMLVKPL